MQGQLSSQSLQPASVQALPPPPAVRRSSSSAASGGSGGGVPSAGIAAGTPRGSQPLRPSYLPTLLGHEEGGERQEGKDKARWLSSCGKAVGGYFDVEDRYWALAEHLDSRLCDGLEAVEALVQASEERLLRRLEREGRERLEAAAQDMQERMLRYMDDRAQAVAQTLELWLLERLEREGLSGAGQRAQDAAKACEDRLLHAVQGESQEREKSMTEVLEVLARVGAHSAALSARQSKAEEQLAELRAELDLRCAGAAPAAGGEDPLSAPPPSPGLGWTPRTPSLQLPSKGPLAPVVSVAEGGTLQPCSQQGSPLSQAPEKRRLQQQQKEEDDAEQTQPVPREQRTKDEEPQTPQPQPQPAPEPSPQSTLVGDPLERLERFLKGAYELSQAPAFGSKCAAEGKGTVRV